MKGYTDRKNVPSAKARGMKGAVIGMVIMAAFILFFDSYMTHAGNPIPMAEKSRYLGMMAVAPLYGFGYAFGYKKMLAGFAKALHFSGKITMSALIWWCLTGSKKGFIRGFTVICLMFSLVAGGAWIPGIPMGIRAIREENRKTKKNSTEAVQGKEKAALRAGSTLQCFGGELAGASFDLGSGETIVIGRDPEMSNIVLSGRTISRKHCEICYSEKDGCAMVKDLSANGVTFLNGTAFPKNQFVKVKSGDGIRLGKSGEVFLFS